MDSSCLNPPLCAGVPASPPFPDSVIPASQASLSIRSEIVQLFRALPPLPLTAQGTAGALSENLSSGPRTGPHSASLHVPCRGKGAGCSVAGSVGLIPDLSSFSDLAEQKYIHSLAITCLQEVKRIGQDPMGWVGHVGDSSVLSCSVASVLAQR